MSYTLEDLIKRHPCVLSQDGMIHIIMDAFACGYYKGAVDALPNEMMEKGEPEGYARHWAKTWPYEGENDE
jgi:hypothetical protein